MKNADSRLRTLEFQGQPLYYLALPEGNLVLIRPLCDLLGLDAEWQIKALQEDEILRDERGEHTVRLPEHDRARQWICLPEEFIYGWIFGIKAGNTMKHETRANLTAYKRECYHALFQHFHGKLKEPQELDKTEAVIDLELTGVRERLAKKLLTDPDHLRILELEDKKKAVQRARRLHRRESQQTAFDFALSTQQPVPTGE